MSPTTLSADSSIAAWLAHPVGGPILRDLCRQGNARMANVWRDQKAALIGPNIDGFGLPRELTDQTG